MVVVAFCLSRKERCGVIGGAFAELPPFACAKNFTIYDFVPQHLDLLSLLI